MKLNERTKTQRLCDFLISVMEDDTWPQSIRFRAAELMLEHGFGVSVHVADIEWPWEEK